MVNYGSLMHGVAAAAQARNENSAIAFAIPNEGSAVWQDNMVIPQTLPIRYGRNLYQHILSPDWGQVAATPIHTPNEHAELLLGDEYFVSLQQVA